MKKLSEFLKALGAFLAIGLFLAFVVVSIIMEFFPTALPDWVHTVLLILDLPIFIGTIVCFCKENKEYRNSKRNR